MKELQLQAIELIRLIEEREKEYYEVNNQLRKLQGDFYTYIQINDERVGAEMVKLLDKILKPAGCELASYYLYECTGMKDGGAIYEGIVEYKIRDIEDLKKYVFRNNQ